VKSLKALVVDLNEKIYFPSFSFLQDEISIYKFSFVVVFIPFFLTPFDTRESLAEADEMEGESEVESRDLEKKGKDNMSQEQMWVRERESER
jgi:hypothetical protein